MRSKSGPPTFQTDYGRIEESIIKIELTTSIGVGGFRKLTRREQVSVMAMMQAPKSTPPPSATPMSKAQKRELFDKQLAAIRG